MLASSKFKMTFSFVIVTNIEITTFEFNINDSINF